MSSNRVGYGQRRVRVTPELIEAWFVDGNAVKTNLPDDARLCSMWPPRDGDEHDTVTLVFESEVWDELDEGEKIPVIVPKVTEK